jgi:hypothetical protein
MHPVSHPARIFDAQATRKLAEVGFYAATTGKAHLAKVIFRGLRMDQPDSIAASLGLAVSEALSGDTSASLQILDGIVCECPQEMANVQAWRGFVHHLGGRNRESARILGNVAGAQGPGGALARQLLDIIPRTR